MEARLACAVVIILSVSIVSEQTNVIKMYNEARNDDYGRITNCGAKESDFLLQWTPRVLRTGVDYYIDASLKVVKSFDHGEVCVSVYLKGVPDPIYEDCSIHTCSEFKNFIKPYYPSLPCPIPAGYSYTVKKFKANIPPTLPLPSGEFNVTATVKNQDGVLLFCATGDVQIEDGDY